MNMSRIVFDEEDPSTFLQIVDQRDRFARDVEQLYREGTLPLVTFASVVGRSPLEVWQACTEHDSARVPFGFGNDEETDRAAALLKEADAIVLDTVALFTIHELGIIDVLRKRFDRIALPRLVFDDSLNLSFNTETVKQSRGFIGKTDDGRYTMSDVPEDRWNTWKEKVKSVLALANSLDIIPSYGLLDRLDVEQILSHAHPRWGRHRLGR